ncbi:hypothetical protein [Paenibacillus luteus]|uniref:hypothetical protein n=1 Tax=Paenibacillus luteus TaxID=2545753 RepID=UPI001144396B|nr:hypothetical protein [Paenibacillus luteus]
MREQLQALEGKRSIFTGEFEKVSGKKEHSGSGPAVLLCNIKDQSGQLLADHLWIEYSQEFEAMKLKRGEQIVFRARVGQYQKGKTGQIVDYKLYYPSNIQRYGWHLFKGKRRKRGLLKREVHPIVIED